MVRILDRTIVEKKILERQLSLEKIVRNFVKEEDICTIPNAINLYKNSILIIPSINEIAVSAHQYFNTAINIASACENIYNEEFTVKKRYSTTI